MAWTGSSSQLIMSPRADLVVMLRCQLLMSRSSVAGSHQRPSITMSSYNGGPI